jgi:AraC-like DNA-binding protein
MELTGTLIDNRYEVGALMAEGGMCRVYRGHDRKTGRPLAVKALKEGRLSRRLDDLVRFHVALEAVSRLESPFVERVIAWRIVDAGMGSEGRYVIAEHAGGASLAELLAAVIRLNPVETVALGLQVAQALASVHGAGVIHGDVKPGNVMVDVSGGGGTPQAVLIDFGLSRLRREEMEHVPANPSGTYPYMSPEQAGIIRRPVDVRSDLYSLGALLYETLTGRPPITGETLVKLLHSLAADVPPPPSAINGTISPELDTVVLKLLEKEPERRYQSARGLLHDLERIAGGERGFAAGAEDTTERLDFTGEMAGRDGELSLLLDRYDDVRSGKGRAVFITGEAGIGKSRLAEELRRRVMESQVFFVEGRATNRENKSPHGPFRDAMGDFLRQYRRLDAGRRDEITGSVRREMGELGKIVTDFEPSARELLGECTRTVPLEPAREIQRFYLTMSRFYLCLARACGGLALFLDDLHWADGGTLDLIEEMLHRIKEAPLFLLCAYRDGELGPEHPLQAVAAGRKEGDAVEDLHLSPLDPAAARWYLAGVLRIDDEALAAYASRCSGGNPLFIQEIVKGLASAGLLKADGGAWRADPEMLGRVEAPPTVADALIRRAEFLDTDDRDLLSRAAAVGRSIDTNLLLILEKRPGYGEEEVRRIVAAVDRSVERQILTAGPVGSGRVSFTHDRVRDAFYGLVPPEERPGLHGRIGRAMEEMYADRQDVVLFELAHHFIRAGDEKKTLKYAWQAGMKARDNFAYRDAIGYFTVIRAILETRYMQSCDEEEGRRFLQCTVLLAEMNLEVFESGIAIDLLNRVMPGIKGNEELNTAYLILTRAYFMKADYEQSEEMACMGLALLGERMPRTRAGLLISIWNTMLARLFHSLQRQVLPWTDRDKSDVSKRILKYFDWLWYVYNFTDTLKLAWLVLRRLAIAESMIGPSQELELCRMNYAQLLAMAFPRRRKRPVRYSLDTIKTKLDERGLSSFYYLRGFIHYLHGDYFESRRDLKRCIDISDRIGDAFMVYTVSLLVFLSHHLHSEYEDAQKAYDKAMGYAKNDFERMIVGGWSFPREYYIETGRYDSAEKELEEHAHKLFEFRMWIHYCYACGDYAYLHVERGEPEKALPLLAEAKSLMKRYRLPEVWIPNFFTRYAQALTADYMKKRSGMPNGDRRRSLRAIQKACRTAVRKTRTVNNLFIAMVSHRLMAQYHVLVGRHDRAVRSFEKSIGIARSVGRRYELARSLYEYGAYMKECGDWPGAWRLLTEAYVLFEEIGVPVYRERFAGLLGVTLQADPSAEGAVSRERMQYMVEQSSLVSGSEGIPELLGRVLSLSMELSGARNGWLLLFDDEQGRLVEGACRTADDGVAQVYSRHMVERVYESGEYMVCADASSDGELSLYRSVSGQELRSVLCLPVSHNELVDGVLYLDNPLAAGVFTGETVKLLSMLLSNAAVLIENVLLRKRLESLGRAERSKPSSVEGNLLKRACEFIDRSLGEEDLKERLSAELGVSADYLGRVFRQYTGMSLREYIAQRRIRRAMEHLVNTDRKVIDIAFDTGFDSLRTFYRLFYRAAGMTPSEYRERSAGKTG